MLSKLFSNIKLGLSIWLVLFSVSLWCGNFYLDLSNSSQTLVLNWVEIGIAGIILIACLFLNFTIFNSLFRVTNNNYYSPFFLAIFISWATFPFQWETALEVFIISIFYLNTYSIFNGKVNNQIGYHLNAGFLSLMLLWLTPLGVGFLLLSVIQAALDKHRNWRKFVLPFYSFAFSFLILYGIAFLFNFQENFLEKFKIWNLFGIDVIQTKTNSIQLLVLFFFFLLGQSEFFKALRKAPILKRKALTILNLQFILTLLLFILFGSKAEYLTPSLFALSVVFANYVQYIKKMAIRELLIWISVATGLITSTVSLL